MHYVGRLVSTGEEFLDTKAESQSGEPVQVVAGRGKLKCSRSNVSLHAHLISVKLPARGSMESHGLHFGSRMKESDRQCSLTICVALADSSMREVGLNLGVASMRKGERCLLRVQPQYGYGERGATPATFYRMPCLIPWN